MSGVKGKSGVYKRKIFTEEARSNMSLVKKGKMPKFIPKNGVKFKKGQIPWNKGRKERREDVLKRQSNSHVKSSERLTPINKTIRMSARYKEWRTSVFIRDNRCCVLCKSKKEIQADHYPIPFSAILNKLIIEQGLENLLEKATSYELFWLIDNGRTLCFECHKKTDTYGGKAYKFNIN